MRGNLAADQGLVLNTMIVQSLYFLNPKLQASSHLLWFEMHLVGNLEDRFSHDVAQSHVSIKPVTIKVVVRLGQ